MNIKIPTVKSFTICILLTAIFTILAGIQACSPTKETTGRTVAKDTASINQKSILPDLDDAEKKPTAENNASKKSTISANLPIDSLMAGMSLREKIGQLFVIRAYGTFKNDKSERYRELVHNIQDYHAGGIIFFNGTVYGQAILTNKLQQLSKIPLWITQDMEYGAAMRVERTTRFTPAMGVAATQNAKYAYWMGKITAQEANALGVNQIFAPDMDVNNNPKNPVINVRSFSANPDTVARYGDAFIRGVQSEDVIATAKHFPGHGDTDTDSHLSLPVINYGYARLDSVELVPFKSAVKNRISSIMSAHIAFPNLSSDADMPATLDSTILHRILRDSLNFNGVVVTDAMEMKGITSRFSPGEAVIKALKAGSDMILLSPDALTAIDEIEMAIKQGRLSEQRIDRSVWKILHWKKKYGLFKKTKVNIADLSNKINTPKDQLLANEISRKSLTLVKNKNHILPISAAKFPRIMVLSVSDDKSGSTGTALASQMRRYHPYVISHVLDNRSSKEERKKIRDDAQKADLIVIGSFIYVRSGRKVQLSDKNQQFLKKLTAHKPSCLIAFGNPYIVQDLPKTDVQLLAWAANNGQIKSVAPALFGGAAISGKLPIDIPGMYDFNDGISLPQTTLRYDQPEVANLSSDSLQNVDNIIHRAVYDSTFPGGVVTVIKDGVIAYNKGFGYETYNKLKQVKSNEIYDLASLTKVLATTPAIMKLIDEGKIHLDDKVSKFIPEFSGPSKENITIRNLLLHNSGLPAFRIYVDSLKTRKKILDAVNHEPLINKPGSKFVYSDLGFILLGEIVHKVTGKPLDKYVRQKFYYPLGMNSSFFNPNKIGNWISRRIPPSQIDTLFRHKTLRGEVNDERAYYMNGIAGHAGLFASGKDIAVFCQMLLNNGSYAGRNYLDPATIKIFTQRQSKLTNRGYGFDRKSKGFSTAGTLSSKATYGHLGFTGTSFWIDPEKDLAIILLTNRTFPQRSYGKNINKIRAEVADAVLSSIKDIE